MWSLRCLLFLRERSLHPLWQTAFSLQGELFFPIFSIEFVQEYWKWHRTFYKETLEEYCHPSGVPMNWDGRRYDVPNLGFKKTMAGLFLTIYGPVVVTPGSILILLVKYVPIQLHALFRYLQLGLECNCALLPFWLVGIPLVIGIQFIFTIYILQSNVTKKST